MPCKLQVFNIAVVALQYSLVILLYCFLYRVVKIAIRDMASLTFNKMENPSVGKSVEADGMVSPAKLMVIEDKQQLLSATSFTITDNLTIGRSQHNDIVIDSSFVSHEHACISRLYRFAIYFPLCNYIIFIIHYLSTPFFYIYIIQKISRNFNYIRHHIYYLILK